DAVATIRHRDAHGAVGAGPGRDGEVTIGAVPHGVEAIHDQVQDDLLELNSIRQHHGQGRGELGVDRYTSDDRIAPHETDDVLDDGVEVEGCLVRVVLLHERPQ